jgi:membrane dipeptidase
LRRLIDTFSTPESEVKIVRNDAEYEAARASGHHAAFVGIQGGNALDENIDALDRLTDDWVVRVTLVHLTSSSIGQTSSPMRLGADRGLTDFGRQYVESLNHRKVLVDLAHISRQGFFDAADVHDSDQPLVVTHTGISGVHEHWRNLDDEQLRTIARTGGTVGVMYQSSFLGEPWWGGRAEAVVRHLAHIVETVGDDHASLGSDWDGAILPPRDLRTVERLPCVVQCMLDRGWSADRIRKILGGNFRRVVRQLRG